MVLLLLIIVMIIMMIMIVVMIITTIVMIGIGRAQSIQRRGARSRASRDTGHVRERGSAPKRDRHSTILFDPR